MSSSFPVSGQPHLAPCVSYAHIIRVTSLRKLWRMSMTSPKSTVLQYLCYYRCSGHDPGQEKGADRGLCDILFVEWFSIFVNCDAVLFIEFVMEQTLLYLLLIEKINVIISLKTPEKVSITLTFKIKHP
jgi:hypothetical protein